MVRAFSSDAARRREAEQLIRMARAKLTGDSEEMAAIYLDHALAALREIAPETVDTAAAD